MANLWLGVFLAKVVPLGEYAQLSLTCNRQVRTIGVLGPGEAQLLGRLHGHVALLCYFDFLDSVCYLAVKIFHVAYVEHAFSPRRGNVLTLSIDGAIFNTTLMCHFDMVLHLLSLQIHHLDMAIL